MGSVQALESNLAQIRLGEGNIAPFQLLGISPIGKNAVQVIEDLREAIKGIDDMTATNIIQQMGLSPEMLTLLRMSKEEMAQYSAIAQQYMLSPEQRQAMQQYAMGLRLVHMQLNYIKDTLILKLMPAFINFSKNLATIINQGAEIVNTLVDVIQKVPLVRTALGGLAMFIMARFNPVLAAITALYLLLEDIAVYFAGGKSVTGLLFGNNKNNNIDVQHPYKSGFNAIMENPLLKMITNPLSSGTEIIKNFVTNAPNPAAINNRNITQNNYITSKEIIPNQTATQLTDLLQTQLQINTTY